MITTIRIQSKNNKNKCLDTVDIRLLSKLLLMLDENNKKVFVTARPDEQHVLLEIHDK